uniref:Epoxide hydrolase n=1 Tax=Syphacia muris TaxID=451379 RepID=A0A0N5B165_9BILA
MEPSSGSFNSESPEVFVRNVIDLCFTDRRNTFATIRGASDDYFGEGDIQGDILTVNDYTLEISNDVIEKLKQKVHEETQNLVSVVEKLDEKPQECPETEVEIEGLRIHFVRVSFLETYKSVVPLILLHDWSTSFWFYYKVIPIFSNPIRFGFDFGVKKQIAFDVIVPSIPGLGFSDIPKKPATMMSLICPTSLRGIHLLNPSMSTFDTSQIQIGNTIADLVKLVTDANYTTTSTTFDDSLFKVWPESQQIAYANSVLGTMSLLLNRWASGTDPNYLNNSIASLHEFFTVDELLTNTVISWITQSVPRSLRLFKNTALDPITKEMFRASVVTPTAILIAPDASYIKDDIEAGSFKKRYFNITQFHLAESGGNYYALQKPQKFAEDVFLFVESIVG